MAVTINGTDGIETNTDTGKVKVGANDDLVIEHGGTNSVINNKTGHLDFQGNGTKKMRLSDGGDLQLDDSRKVELGNSQDLQLYHDGSHSYIKDAGTGALKILASDFYVNNAADDENMIKALSDGAVELYYNNSKKLYTKNDGIVISEEVVLNNAVNTYPWTATGDVAHGVLLNSLTTNVNFPIAANSNDTIACILNRTNGNGRILEFKYNGSVVGNIDSNGSSLPSDRDFKTNISDLNLGLSLVNKLKPSQFNYKIDDANTPVMYGLIAQELEETLTSEGVTKNSTQLIQHHPTDDTESNYSVDYLKLVPILINSIKELSTEVNTLKTKVVALEAHTHE